MTSAGERPGQSIRTPRSDQFRKPMHRAEATEKLEKVFGRSCNEGIRAAHISFLSEIAEKVYDSEPILHSVFSQIGSRWGLQIIVSFGGGPHRFSTLLKILSPVSKQVLTTNLRTLERDGFISKTSRGSGLAHVEYDLTELGRELFNYLMAMIDWLSKNAKNISLARSDFDSKNPK